LPPLIWGDVAQLVEQRTENPCVVGSIPIITTHKKSLCKEAFLFLAAQFALVISSNPIL
jgi:hypothetical protein